MKKYLLLTTGISVLFLILYYFGNTPLFSGYLHDLFPGLILFFFLQSLVISWVICQGQKDEWKSPIYALGTVSIRLLTGIFFMAILMLSKVEGSRVLIIQFTALYLIYLIFELYVVLANLRQN